MDLSTLSLLDQLIVGRRGDVPHTNYTTDASSYLYLVKSTKLFVVVVVFCNFRDGKVDKGEWKLKKKVQFTIVVTFRLIFYPFV